MENKKYGKIASFILFLLGYVLAGFGSLLGLFSLSILFSAFSSTISQVISVSLASCFCLTLYFYFLSKTKKFNDLILKLNLVYVLTAGIITSLLFYLSKGSLLNPLISYSLIFIIPLLPLAIILSIYGNYIMLASLGCVFFYSLILSLILLHKRKYTFSIPVYLVCAILCIFTYFTSPNYKYRNQNHGFTYMGGFSSTDFTDYHVYSESSKLVVLDHQPAFMIENPEEMPVLDGAEACYPLYAAVAKTLYKDIDSIELQYKHSSEALHYGTSENGSIVTFYNTAVGFERLVAGDVDIFFGAKPSASQQEYAQEAGVELVYTPIGKEAFVFFVEEDNPVDSLTTDQIRSIYHGDLTNWKELGGKNEEIIAFQRPERSGSQSMMIYFMNDVPLKEPLTYEMEMSMMGIIENVAEYENEAGAIGYSFRYFLEGLNEEEHVKMLKVNDIYPSNESIQNGTYPIVATLYCITIKDNKNPYVQQVLDFLLSEDGQTIIEKTGYSPLN